MVRFICSARFVARKHLLRCDCYWGPTPIEVFTCMILMTGQRLMFRVARRMRLLPESDIEIASDHLDFGSLPEFSLF